MNSPCKGCTIRNPMTCNGNNCTVGWREWWIETWDKNRLIVLKALTKKEEQNGADKPI